MLDTGFDAPEVVNLVMARFTKSNILYQQMEEFQAYHFTLPPFSLNGGYSRARQVFGDEDALKELLASLNAAVFPTAPGSSGPAPEQPSAH
jgi:type I restriction enzyme R subunit